MRFLFLFLLAGVALPAQQLSSIHYDVESGLPSSELYDVHQDRQGFIWLASDRGVSRFDGYTFRNFTKEDSLGDNTIFNIYEDGTGRLWFNAFNGALSWYGNGHFHLYAFNDSIRAYTRPPRILRSFACTGNSLVLGYYDGGMLSIDSTGHVSAMQEYPGPPSGFFAVSGKRWPAFAVGRSLCRPDSVTNRQVRGFSYSINGHEGIVNIPLLKPTEKELILALPRRNGSFSFGLVHTFVEISGDGIVHTETFDDEIIRICEDNDSCLWVSFRKGGVKRYTRNGIPGTAACETFFGSEIVSCVFQDSEGGFWITTLGNGVYYVPCISFRTYFTSGDRNTTAVTAIVPDGKGGVFAGMRNGIVHHYTTGGNWETYNAAAPGFSGDQALAGLFCDTLKQQLYVAFSLGGGLRRMDRSGNFSGLSPTNLHCVTTGAGGNIYTGSNNEIGCMNDSDRSITLKRGISIDAVYTDREGTTWMGGMNGLYRMRGDSAVAMDPRSPVMHTRITGIAGMPDGRLALATVGSGVLFFDGKNTTSVSEKDGLCGDIVNGVATGGNGELWVATNKGVSVLYDSAGAMRIKNFHREQGLPTEEVMCIAVSGGNVWLGTRFGLTSLPEKETERNLTPPPVYLYSVMAGDSSLSLGDDAEADLGYARNSFRFSFAGLSFRAQGKVHYRYHLEGLNDDWVETDAPQAIFFSLDPGEYRFTVYALNNDGIPSVFPATFSFRIRPPFWRTWWFILVAAAGVVSVAVYLILLSFSRAREKHEMRARISEYQQQALANQMNPHFIFNSLNSIQSYIAQEDRRSAIRYLSRFSRLMRLSLDHSREKTVPLKEELELVSVYMELEAMRFKERMEWSMETEEGLDYSRYEIPAMLIQPYVENAIRHGLLNRDSAGGKVTVRIYTIGERLCCEVEDNGIGREAAGKIGERNRHRSAGTSITSSRLRLLCRTMDCPFHFEIIDRNNDRTQHSGTIVKFDLPYRKKTANRK
ncbi:MAG TPA: histidine kinase [Bacteroidia bacterium]|nr:histidine kinase [Bacteroidia bacterium]